jgi:hypothetical protein
MGDSNVVSRTNAVGDVGDRSRYVQPSSCVEMVGFKHGSDVLWRRGREAWSETLLGILSKIVLGMRKVYD